MIRLIEICSSWSSQCSWELLGNAIPFLLSNAVFMDENIIAKGVQVAAEYQWSVHKRAWVNQFSLLPDFHLLDVEYKAAVKDLESQGALTSKNQDFVVRDLVGKAHIARNPLRFVQRRGSALNLLPDVLRDVVTLNCINYILLIDPSTECENEVVFE